MDGARRRARRARARAPSHQATGWLRYIVAVRFMTDVDDFLFLSQSVSQLFHGPAPCSPFRFVLDARLPPYSYLTARPPPLFIRAWP